MDKTYKNIMNEYGDTIYIHSSTNTKTHEDFISVLLSQGYLVSDISSNWNAKIGIYDFKSSFEITVPIGKAIDIIENMNSGEQLFVRNSRVNISKQGSFWKLNCPPLNDNGVHVDEHLAEISAIDNWVSTSNVWSLTFEKEQLSEMGEYLGEKYGLELIIPHYLFEELIVKQYKK